MDAKRPSAEDTDEDLMRFQTEFLSSRAKPAVTIVKPSKGEDQKLKQQSVEGNESIAKASTSKEEVPEGPPSVLLKIMEQIPKYKDSSADFQSKISFPRPFKRTIDHAETKGIKSGKSIFAQEMKKRKAANQHTSFESCLEQERLSLNVVKDQGNQSHLVDGSGLNSKEESKKIHDENLNKLKSMTKEEIEEHQKQILSHLDPKMIEFLQSRNKVQGHSKEKPVKKVSFSNEDVKMESQESSDLEIVEEELPIRPEQIKANKWLGMNKVEWKKLEWMKNLPEPKPFDPQSGNSARFDLEGNLITGKTDVPIHLGLHHHGDEPEKPGYTFEELFRLSRSDLSAQRCLALNTMSHILSLNSKGRFDDVLTKPLLPQLIESGLVLLLRCAIDDEQASVWTAGIAALHSLLVSQVDEEALDQVFAWPNGHSSPFLCPKDSPIIVEIEDEDEQIEKLKDHEIVQKDVILGLMRMDLLPRLRYIIEVLKPDSVVTNNILGILIRVARHSPQLSEHLYKCPRLIEIISDSFLPYRWSSNNSQMTNSYGIPSRLALKLFRILCSADVIIAERLLVNHKIEVPLKCYLTCNPNDDRLPLEDTLKLSVEALRTWQSFLHYGLTCEIFLDLFPVWMSRLSFCQNLSCNDISHRGDLNYSAIFVSTLTILIHKLSNDTSVVEEGHFSSVLSLIIGITKKWTLEMTEACPNDMSEGWTALATNLRFLHTFFEKFASTEYQLEMDQLKLIVERWITHPSFTKITSKMRLFSSLLDQNNSSRYPDNLPTTGAVLWNGKGTAKVLSKGTFVSFQVSLSGALLFLAKNHPKLNESIFKIYYKELDYYLKAVYEKFQNDDCFDPNLNWFSKFEMSLVINLLLIIGSGKVTSIDMEFYHELSLILPPFVLTLLGETWLNKLLDFAIFNPVYYVNALVDEARNRLATLSVTNTQIPINESNLKNNLCRIKSNYSIAFHWRFSKPESSSLVHFPITPSKLNKNDPWRRSNALKEWIFLPLTTENLKNNPTSIERCLDWIYFLMKNRKSLIARLFKPGKIFSNIATVFLLEGEPFLIPEIKMILSDILSFYINNWPTPLLSEAEIGFPVLELFEDLINQFEAASYGDKLFSNLIVIFLQASYPPQFKTLFYKEHRMAISFIRLNLTESMLPIEQFLKPLETNEEVIEVYFHLLLSGAFSRTPLLFAISMYHLHHYLFTSGSEECQFKNKALKTIAGLCYKKKSCDELLKFKEICLITRTLKYHDEIPSDIANLLNLSDKM